jgi:nucleotide-binding universal stress UspA family protein
MIKPLKGPAARVAVAIAFDEETPGLVKTAESLCLVSGMSLRLVHTCESPYGTWAGHPFSNLLSSEVIEDSEEIVLAGAEKKIAELEKAVDGRIQVSHNILFGRPPENIIADSIASRVSLIVSATSKTGHRFVLKGFSTALSLISDAPVPVLVIPGGVELDMSRRGLRILLADDLRPEREDARQAAFALAAVCPESKLLHVHVNPLSEQHLVRMLERTAASHPGGSGARELSSKSLYKGARDELAARLESFGSPCRQTLTESGGRYESALLEGDVVESLERKMVEWDPEIIVFGRHHLAQRRSLLPGQLPFRTMLSQKRAIMVAPSAK